MTVYIYQEAFDLPQFVTCLSTEIKPLVDARGVPLRDRSRCLYTDTGAEFLLLAGVWYPQLGQADLAAMQADIAALKAQNQTVQITSHEFVFGAADTGKTAAIAYNGSVSHLHLVVPDFTNVVTATVTLVDASGRVLWTSAAKAKNASYNLDDLSSGILVEQFVDHSLSWVVTLSGAPGGDGGTVVLVPRYYGV
ncbi:MAG: hypothetical protein M1438_09545 [Deltaproteobacteria bacterium]|nr:hypothetical protein [Deltaproteobacteria bacterium]